MNDKKQSCGDCKHYVEMFFDNNGHCHILATKHPLPAWIRPTYYPVHALLNGSDCPAFTPKEPET